VLPLDRIRSGEFPWPTLRNAFFEGFHRSLAAYAQAGNNLIVEHIIETPQWLQRLGEILRSFDVFLVGVHCPLEEIEQRERARGDRRLGDARRDFETIHAFVTYDLELDATEPPAANARRVIDAWRYRQTPSGFERLFKNKEI
jgi:chloramphenicol 3-O phosphotransferase